MEQRSPSPSPSPSANTAPAGALPALCTSTINIDRWLRENADALKPPVNNFCLYDEKDFTVMIIGGAEQRGVSP